ncbi:DciA family protein [Spirochaetia bacterium 38H-sp]|uniref:DciA family protein n=1 Tax=Rarispira pelagica TaxID=3141764 RepID=A0ABU9U983_9SPIR
MKKASDLIEAILSSYVSNSKDDYFEFFKNWRVLLGDKLAYHCKIEDVKDNCLIVSFDDAIWLQEFSLKRQGVVLSYIKKNFPQLSIKNIEMYVRDIVVDDNDVTEDVYIFKKNKPLKKKNRESEKKYFSDPVDNIKDDKLKVLLKRLKDAIDYKENGKA